MPGVAPLNARRCIRISCGDEKSLDLLAEALTESAAGGKVLGEQLGRDLGNVSTLVPSCFQFLF